MRPRQLPEGALAAGTRSSRCLSHCRQDLHVPRLYDQPRPARRAPQLSRALRGSRRPAPGRGLTQEVLGDVALRVPPQRRLVPFQALRGSGACRQCLGPSWKGPQAKVRQGVDEIRCWSAADCRPCTPAHLHLPLRSRLCFLQEGLRGGGPPLHPFRVAVLCRAGWGGVGVPGPCLALSLFVLLRGSGLGSWFVGFNACRSCSLSTTWGRPRNGGTACEENSSTPT